MVASTGSGLAAIGVMEKKMETTIMGLYRDYCYYL